MAISVYMTDWDTAGQASASGRYIDVDVSANTGSLLVAAGASSNYYSTRTDRSISTFSGSLSSWTTSATTPTSDEDTDAIIGWATAQADGTHTVRATLRCWDTDKVGVVVWVFPSGEWSGTPTLATITRDETDASPDFTVSSGDSTVLWLGADWLAVDITNLGLTPSGGQVDVDAYVSGGWQVIGSDWTSQAAGTRNYGLANDPGTIRYSHLFAAVQGGAKFPPHPAAVTTSRSAIRAAIY